MTILDAMSDPTVFGRWFKGDSWEPWRVFLAAVFALPMTKKAAMLYRRHTGRQKPPSSPAREAWVVVGRRGGKSRIAALVATYLACFRTYDDVLAPGEVGTLAVIAADRRQARTVMRYLTGFVDAVPMLQKIVTNRTKETIELANRVVIEVHTASFRSTRGYTLIGVVCDEIAFWPTDDDGANPDHEILAGLRPGMATVPGALLLCISSPYARRGSLWQNYHRHFGQEGDSVLVWQADTKTMHPSVDDAVIAEAYRDDEASAAAEYGAEFRRDIESYISRETVDAIVVPGRRELPPAAWRYQSFTDPSGGSSDSMTLAIAHAEPGKVVLDCTREWRPPFRPSAVVAEIAEILQAYKVRSVTGDRYGGEWPRERFKEHGISYEPAEQAKSDIYRDVLPLLNSGFIELLDHPRMLAQLLALDRRTARGGRDSIDHPPRGHDDLINAAAGAILLAAPRRLEAIGQKGPWQVKYQDIAAMIDKW